MLARAAFPAFFFTFAGFLLFLLVTLSVPIIKTIYLLQVKGEAGGRAAKIGMAANAGVFGLCYKGGQASILGFDYSSNAACTDASVGYEFDDTFLGLSDNSGSRALIKGLTGSLILNVITCGLAGISLVLSFFAWCCSSRAMEILTFISLIFAAFASWLSFALDLALALVTRNRIEDYTNDLFTGEIGNAVWIALGGAVALTLAICLAGCGMFGRYSDRGNRAVVHEKTGYRRRYFWQRRGSSAARGTY
ncbi:hypothetical protein I317_06131 [Kwoniella heveanensis CBS 569]|nr:hypothetical protein I317_06131 [Kwoniella heveanensis CBS 569]